MLGHNTGLVVLVLFPHLFLQNQRGRWASWHCFANQPTLVNVLFTSRPLPSQHHNVDSRLRGDSVTSILAHPPPPSIPPPQLHGAHDMSHQNHSIERTPNRKVVFFSPTCTLLLRFGPCLFLLLPSSSNDIWVSQEWWPSQWLCP